MHKKLLLLIVLSGSFYFSEGQITDSRIIIDTTVEPALYFESTSSTEDVSKAIESYFDSMHIQKEKGRGFIIKKSLGYLLFKSARVEGVSDFLDYYFVVNTKKQKGKDGSAIFLSVSNFGKFLSPDNDPSGWASVKNFASFLESNYFQQYEINTTIASVSKEIDKHRKKLVDVLKQKSDLETSITSDSLKVVNLQSQLMQLKKSQ